MRKKRKRPYGKILLLCIATLLLTYGMGKYFEHLVLKFSNNNPEGRETTYNKFEVTRQVTDVYLIQNGVFSVYDGAQNQFSKLKAAGFYPVIFEEGHYRIITGVYLNRERAVAELQLQRDLGFENYLVELKLPTISVEVSTTSEKDKVEAIFKTFNRVLENTEQYFINNLLIPLEVEDLTYQGDEEQLLGMLELIELYYAWQNSPDQTTENQYLVSTIKYLRKNN